MKPPFLIDDAGDFSVFSTLADTEKDLEPPDVDRSDCAVYDSEGRRLRLELEAGFLRRRVRLSAPDDPSPTDAERLRTRLAAFLIAIGENRSEVERLPLDALVSLAESRLKGR